MKDCKTGWYLPHEWTGPQRIDMLEGGFIMVGHGVVPDGYDVVNAPTGTKSKGFAGKKSRIYVGRWMRKRNG